MDYPALFQPKWNAKKFLLCNLVALALLLVWIWPTGHAAFTQFDEWFFHLLNQPLTQNKAWLWTWTIASMRPFDIIVGLILLMLLIKGDWVFKAAQTRAALIGFVLTLILLLIIRTVFSKIIDHTSLQHDSASMVIPDAVKLSEIFPTLEDKWQLKDRSSQSFPGDHASVLLIWAMFMTVYSRTVGQRVVIWVLAFLFMMPRLVAGAHWGQDDYIGGVMIALLALAWSCYTPFAAHATRFLMRVTAPLFNLFGKLPLLGCLSIMKPGARA
ncbi:phosphatase PAP2 family protein [Pseudomonas sp. GD03842]|uniref:phosphatase PAP2 family protein n=1 Tax=unclassified Pseudomonas TaxID=196821 RepID=UPI000D360A16|nr:MULTISPECIES: phosphatase PAP2 family protein [unclassified Pseudomonas]MDH0745817.1 phosphatase PAP2 family protein [Pseudomonas sp. GD03842]RAU48745.1 phosphatase PAP2 family protein [Pseudomonas sp. RIT 409]RAU53995.1 phosphatase PAP2 family protein [Pseudomonas sp. RIT 412]